MHKVHLIELSFNKDIEVIIKDEEVEEKIPLTNVLDFKDEINLSDKKYSIMLKQLGLKHLLPSLRKIRNERKLIDGTIKVFENSLGIYTDPKTKINQILTIQYSQYPEMFDKEKKIRIKLSGDGTNVKQFHLLNFTFSLPDFKNGQAAKGKYTLGVFEIIKESYEELKICFAELIPMLKSIEIFQINEEKFFIEFLLAGDLKFLSNMMGINAANSNYACPWCKCHKTDCLGMNWSIFNLEKGARSHEESFVKRQLKNSINKLGYIEAPIFDFIPFKIVIIDLMHLYLRITDKFTNYILDDILSLDGYQDNYESINDPKIENSKNTAKYIHFLKEECKIRNCFYLKDKKIVFRDLRGAEKLVVFNKINLIKLFPDIEDVNSKNNVIQDFNTIYLKIRDNLIQAEEIQILTSQFLIEYLETFMISTISPYLHCFVCHLHEFRLLHQDFNLFNQQGLEKLNDLTSEQVFKATNRKRKETGKTSYLQQLMHKRNRIDTRTTLE